MARSALVSVPARLSLAVGPSKKMELEDWELFTVLRRKYRITQAEVALQSGTYQSQVSRWECGKGEWSEAERQTLWSALTLLIESAPVPSDVA